jgi:hypothetical protein
MGLTESEQIGELTITRGIHESVSNEMVVDMKVSTSTGDFEIPSGMFVEILCSEGKGDLYFEENGDPYHTELIRGGVVRLKSDWPFKSKFGFRASDTSNFSVLLKFSDKLDVCLKDSPPWFGGNEARR